MDLHFNLSSYKELLIIFVLNLRHVNGKL